jgi:hypothetical protein
MTDVKLKPGWLKRQVDKAAEEVARMPALDVQSKGAKDGNEYE